MPQIMTFLKFGRNVIRTK